MALNKDKLSKKGMTELDDMELEQINGGLFDKYRTIANELEQKFKTSFSDPSGNPDTIKIDGFLNERFSSIINDVSDRNNHNSVEERIAGYVITDLVKLIQNS